MVSLLVVILLLQLALSSGFIPLTSHQQGVEDKATLPRRIIFSELSLATTPESSSIDSDEESPSLSLAPIRIDPIITNILHEEAASTVEIGGIIRASRGIDIWRRSLTKGRLPVQTDFVDDQAKCWPENPLFSKLSDAMISMELPRFALRHPETITSIIISLLRLVIKFSEEMKLQQEYKDDFLDDEDYDGYNFWEHDEDLEQDDDLAITTLEVDTTSLSEDEMSDIAAAISKSFLEEWGGVVTGITLLDQIFGPGHEILDMNHDYGDDGVTGFGLEDGVWKHTGWEEIPEVQNQISSMPELRNLLNEIGRRPTSENSDRIHKFAPRKQQQDGGLGAQFDPHLRESVNGITLSGSLSEMLPSEAVLLRGSSPALRRLFLAKKAEAKLLSYQLSGWTDIPSVPLTRPLYSKRMPSAPGGPIVVCLDTSWSMSGKRELLSKSVVLACVTAAHKQKRDCQVVAFSNEKGVIEAGVITADTAGIKRLLDFLGHSFGGGTDVTGALKFAMESIDSDIMEAADILMVTDGEIPDPPVSEDVMEKLDNLKIRKGVTIHGLLVGKRESKPLTRLATKTHDFLFDHDFSVPTMIPPAVTSTALRSSNSGKTDSSPNSISSHIGDHPGLPWGGSRFNRSHSRGRMVSLYAKKKKNDSFDDDNDFDFSVIATGASSNPFVGEVEESLSQLKSAVKEDIDANAWPPESIEKERLSDGSCWKYKGELQAAIARISEGLVEREEEARLVVLAMLANEHVLLLGVPGTGKSVLGRRLSKLCNGTFFQRLLTRFTTPEELFGPLSLRSLENDEYRRVTTGFLPTASVAFLDEIFKANSAILNTLLTILNERKFDNAGGQELCPIRCVVGASNELPESDELVALFDRFLLRKEVYPVSDEGVLKMLALSNPGFSRCDINSDTEEGSCEVVFPEGLDEIVRSLSNAADHVECSVEVAELLRDLRIFMKAELQAEISDRRLVKAVRLLKMCAATDGRTRVDHIDCLLLQHCMWQVPEHQKQLRDWLWENITPGRGNGTGPAQFRLLLDGLRDEAVALVRKTSGDISGNSGGREDDIAAIESLRREVAQLDAILKKRQHDLLRHIDMVSHLGETLWLHPEEVQSIQQYLSPRADQALTEIARSLADARALEMSLSNSSESPDNTYRLDVIEALWDQGYSPEVSFTDDELDMPMKEAKAKYDLETFRKWKRARKALQKLI